jgi:transcriptional regulator
MSTMYAPKAFEESRPEVLADFIRQQSFAAVVSTTGAGLIASHLPLVLDASETVLRGHVARANEHWRAIENGAETVAIFSGPNAYVTPSWYPSKHETGRAVPTWNYIVVHAHGTMRAVDDRAWLGELVAELTDQHEARFEKPWAVADAPADFIDNLLSGIVGVEITITRMQGVWKVSQNRVERDRLGVKAGLSNPDDPAASALAALIS